MIETLQVALGGLTANKLRTGLTILGLMIGVGSVIVLIAVGTGSSDAVEKQIDALGSNVLLVSATPTLGGLRRAATSSTAADGRRCERAAEPVRGARRRERLAGRQRQRRDARPTARRRTRRRRSSARPRATSRPAATRWPRARGSRAPTSAAQPRAGRRPDGRQRAVRRPGPGRRRRSRSTAPTTRSSA